MGNSIRHTRRIARTRRTFSRARRAGRAALVALVGAIALLLAPGGARAARPVAHAPAPPVRADTSRPSTCPPVPANQGGPDGEAKSATGTFPWPPAPPGSNPERYAAYDHTPSVSPPVRPANWTNGGGDWKLTSARTTDPSVAMNPQELCGVEGNSVDQAWQVTTGRPDTVIAITDSGIEWCDTAIVDKIYLNRRALPLPEDSLGRTKPQLEAAGVHFADKDPYDLDNSGVFNIAQYANDPRLTKPYFCGSFVSPADLINTFGRDGKAGSPGFTEAIAGWNFVDDSNNPYDDVHYDHGTGEAEDSTGSANTISQEVGSCPNCMVLPIRVGDSFITGGNEFARAVLFAVDSGASVIQEALGTYDVTDTARQAINYATAHGVPVIASAADEEAGHHNLPAALPGTIVVNSVTHAPTQGGVSLYSPPGYLFLNGCTNYGANIAVSVESASCSSEATGKSGGVAGLIESEARDLVDRGLLQPYPGLSDVSGHPVPLSSTEVRQLISMAADDVDFQTAAPPFPPDNYAVVSPVPTTRYPTQPGFDIYSGYGRLNAGRALAWLGKGVIPPEASFGTMDWFKTYDPASTVSVNALAAAVRTPGQPFQWQLQYGIGDQPEPNAWLPISQGGGTGSTAVHATLTPALLQQIASQIPPVIGDRSSPDAYAFTLRLVVTDANGLVGVDRRTEFVHHDPTMLTSAPVVPGGSIDAPPTFAPIGPNGQNALIVATTDGDIHAYVSSGSSLQELPGWPVHTVALATHLGEPAFTSHQVTAVPHGSIVGGVAVGDLFGSGQLDVVASDTTGHVYAFDAGGRPLHGFPVQTNPAYSGPAVRDPFNRVLRGFIGAPALGHLENPSQLDIIVSSMDRHVYAWRADGSAVPGWPVLVVDRSEVQSIDPTTNKVVFKADSHVTQGTKILDTPALGALAGSGPPDIVVGTNEEYLGDPNVSIADPINWSLGKVPLLNPSNSRVYAIDASGSIVPGWPAAIGDLDAALLPDVGDGVTASPALADLAGNGKLETGVISTVGPGYILNPDGTSYLGNGPDGKPRVLATNPTGALSNSPEYPTLPSLGMPIFAPLGAGAPGISMIAPAVSVGKAIDVALPDQQQPNDSQVDAWNTTTAQLQPAFPQYMNDLQFIAQPIVADVGGDTAGSYLVEASASSDVRAIGSTDQEAPSFPKFTGGWTVNSPSFGPFGTLATQVLAVGTREGELFLWNTATTACAPSGPWPREHHDLWNTGNLQTSGTPAATCP